MSPKNKLHALVDACEDEAILESAIALLSNESEDWWATLPDIEKGTCKYLKHNLR